MRLFTKVSIAVALSATVCTPASADSKLPAPYVSRALDAVLIEVNDDVRQSFGLAATEAGALVIAVDPKGEAAKLDIKPGDVIAEIYGTKVDAPITIDKVAGYWLKHGKTNIGIEWSGGGKTHSRAAAMTQQQFDEGVAMSSVSSWESVATSESFNYESYSEEYASEEEHSYEEATQEIDQAEASEEYASEDMSEASDSNDDGISDSEEDSGGDDGGDDGGGDEE